MSPITPNARAAEEVDPDADATFRTDFLNAIELDEVFWLVKKDGYTQVRRAKENAQLSAYMKSGDQMGYLWKEGFFEGADPQ